MFKVLLSATLMALLTAMCTAQTSNNVQEITFKKAANVDIKLMMQDADSMLKNPEQEVKDDKAGGNEVSELKREVRNKWKKSMPWFDMGHHNIIYSDNNITKPGLVIES